MLPEYEDGNHFCKFEYALLEMKKRGEVDSSEVYLSESLKVVAKNTFYNYLVVR